jgi:hypothetical protein
MLPLHPPKWAIPFRESVPLAGSPPRIGPADALDGVVRSGAAVERRTKARPAAPHRDTPGAGPQHPCPPAPLPHNPLAPEPLPQPRASNPSAPVPGARPPCPPPGHSSAPHSRRGAPPQLALTARAGRCPAATPQDRGCGPAAAETSSGTQRPPEALRGTRRHPWASAGAVQPTRGERQCSPTAALPHSRARDGRAGAGSTGTGSNGGCRASRRARLLGGLVGHRSSGRGLEVLAIALGGPIPLRGLE